MAISYDTQSRGIKVLVNGLHMKTIPKNLLSTFKDHYSEIDFDKKKRITAAERKLLLRNNLYQEYLKKLKISNIHLYNLIKDAKPTAARKVITPDKERLELQLDNNTKITCPSTRLFKLFPHTSDAYLNY